MYFLYFMRNPLISLDKKVFYVYFMYFGAAKPLFSLAFIMYFGPNPLILWVIYQIKSARPGLYPALT